MKPYLNVKDFTDGLSKAVKSLQTSRTLVGVPAEESTREKDAESGEQPINNASILFINEFGSADANIPARPVLSIGIRKAQKAIAEEYKKAAQAVLKKNNVGALGVYYERAGIIASNSVKKVINDQEGLAPISERTAAGRKAEGFAGRKALLVTGQLRNSITYVVKEG